MDSFSFNDRTSIQSKLKNDRYDLLVIGGGITGAGIALDAASRGLKTALVEKNDFAFGTSSRSTKLIHGGLRYLKQLEFGLVKEVGSERAIVHKLAPHLVVPEKMLLPLSEKRGLGYWLTSIGLKLYDWLAGVKPEDQRRMLTRQQTLKYEPLLRPEELKGGAIYAEYRTDDARLTIEIIKTAVRHGADVLNYLKVIDFKYTDNKITGVTVQDQLTKEAYEIRATVVVSAAGPWVDELREVNRSRTGKRLHLTKGVHIVVAREKLPVKQAIYFNVDDGRMIFAIPRGRITYVGTTDTTYTGDKDYVLANRSDAAYLVQAINATFPSVNLSLDDIESSWAGLRPLIHEDGKSASELSRKDEIFESPSGLISIAGGKLTGYRKMAERVVDLASQIYFNKKDLHEKHTDKIGITSSRFADYADVLRYIHSIEDRLNSEGFTSFTAHYLVKNYGRQVDEILENYRKGATDDEPELRLLKAELLFAVQKEMVCTLEDFFVRRTGLLYFNAPLVTKWKSHIADTLKAYLHLDDNMVKRQLSDLESSLFEAKNFNP